MPPNLSQAKRTASSALRNTLPVSLFLFLFAVYLLTYTPRINSSDGLAMFATAENLVRRGALDIEQIRWMGLQQGTYGLDGLLYSRKGIGLPLGLLPLTGLGLIIPWVGPVGMSLLFNAIVTALTAVLLLAYLQQLGFHRRAGLMVALTFGLATLAWPYAKSLFSDPLSGLLLLAAAYTLLKFRDSGQSRWAALAGLFLGWNVATRYAEAIFLPLFGLLLLYYLFATFGNSQPSAIHNLQPAIQNPKSKIQNLKFTIHHSSFITPLLAFSLPLLLTGLGLIGFNLSRYGDPFNTGYLPNETFSGNLWDGVTGQLFSPGRGLLIYCPILLLSFAGLLPLLRRARAEALVALSVILIHLLLYGKWFMWHGGYAWGPRFMIPTLPFWALLLAPVCERAFGRHPSKRGRRFRVAFLLLAALSLIPQLLAVTIDFAPFQNSLLDTGLPLFARQTFFDPQYAALISAWPFISIDSLDLAWAWRGEINWGLLTVLVANVVMTALYLMARWRDSRRQLNLQYPKGTSSPISNLLPLLSTATATIFLLTHTHALPPAPIQQAVAGLNKNIRPTDAIITNNPEMTAHFAELYRGTAPVLGLNNGGFPLPNDITSRLNETIANHRQIWWLPNWLPPEESAIEQTLLAGGIRARQEPFDGQRLVLFVIPANLPGQPQPIQTQFDNQIQLVSLDTPPQSTPGAALPVTLNWQAAKNITQDYHVFIHLLDSTGELVTQADGRPGQGSRPTTSWPVAETITDRHALWIPAETAPGAYQLRIGLYQPAEGRRLKTATGDDAVTVTIEIR